MKTRDTVGVLCYVSLLRYPSLSPNTYDVELISDKFRVPHYIIILPAIPFSRLRKRMRETPMPKHITNLQSSEGQVRTILAVTTQLLFLIDSTFS